MKLRNELLVPAPIQQAWEVLLDVDRVAPCLPGAAIERSEGDEHTGTMTVKIGPITARYKGTLRVEEADEHARRAVMRAQARDARGQGTASATITSTMEEVPEGTRVVVETDMRITGPAAQFGRGVMQDVSAKMMQRFADCLADEITGGPAAPAEAAAGEGASAAAASLPPGPAGDSVGEGRPARPAADVQAEQARGAREPAVQRPTAEVLDLGEAGMEAVLKRAVPAVAVAAAIGVAVAVWLRRRR
jgi:carbon monoxide dehydrogenase subunit G